MEGARFKETGLKMTGIQERHISLNLGSKAN